LGGNFLELGVSTNEEAELGINMQSSPTCVYHLPQTQLYGTDMIFETEYPFYASTTRDMFWGPPAATEGLGSHGAVGGYPLMTEKQGSHTPTSSIINIGPEITMTTPGTTGSYVMVHKRAGSNVSNRTSPVGSDRQGAYSVPSHGSAAEWTHAEHTVEMDVDDEHYRMPHDTKAILFNMSGPGMSDGRNLMSSLTQAESAPVYNAYSPEARLSPHGTSPTPQEYNSHVHASSSASAAYIVNHQHVVPSYSGPSMLGDVSDAPWTHMHARDPQGNYQQSFVGFTPSPRPASEHNPEVHRPSASFQVIEFAANSKLKTKKPENRIRRPKAISKPKAKTTEHGWEHHSVIQRGGVQLMTKPEEKPVQRSGIRRGKLDPDAAEKARKIRRMTACWNCWIQKVPVGFHLLASRSLADCCCAVLSWTAMRKMQKAVCSWIGPALLENSFQRVR
jgi:hypothetical protein